MHRTPQEVIEDQVIVTRFMKDADGTQVSMAGVAYRHENGITGCLLSPNDRNISLPFSAMQDGDSTIFVYHCFVGLFASRIYRCTGKTWSAFRVHMSVTRPTVEVNTLYGELVTEQLRGNELVRLYVEHFSSPIFPHDELIKAAEIGFDHLITPCPVRLTPDPRIYQIGLPLLPHPGLVPAVDHEIATHVLSMKEPKKVLKQ